MTTTITCHWDKHQNIKMQEYPRAYKHKEMGRVRSPPDGISHLAERNRHGVWVIRPRHKVKKVISMRKFGFEWRVLVSYHRIKRKEYINYERALVEFPDLVNSYMAKRWP